MTETGTASGRASALDPTVLTIDNLAELDVALLEDAIARARARADADEPRIALARAEAKLAKYRVHVAACEAEVDRLRAVVEGVG